jgi:Flp pilus assembly protein TadG
MQIRTIRNRSARDGQSIVELALAFPVILLLCLGTVDVGRVFFDYIEMRNAVVEGATYGSRHPSDTSGIVNVAMNHGVPGDTVVSAVTSGNCSTPLGGGSMTVTANRTFTPVFFGGLSAIAPGMDWSFNVRASSTMRCMT